MQHLLSREHADAVAALDHTREMTTMTGACLAARLAGLVVHRRRELGAADEARVVAAHDEHAARAEVRRAQRRVRRLVELRVAAVDEPRDGGGKVEAGLGQGASHPNEDHTRERGRREYTRDLRRCVNPNPFSFLPCPRQGVMIATTAD